MRERTMVSTHFGPSLLPSGIRGLPRTMKGLLRRSRVLVGVKHAATGALGDLRVLRWLVARRRRIQSYLSRSGTRKLHLGASFSCLEGWFNTDIEPVDRKVTYLDAARPFPFEDRTFDFIFSEHMIEHIRFEDGLDMLRECHRVLKPGGVVRIATPDLAVILGLHRPEKTDSQERYVNWIVQRCLPGVDMCQDVFVINNAFRAWGHRFLYDRPTLAAAMHRAGFQDITFVEVGESGSEHLRNLESHGRQINADDVNRFETMVAEGRR